MHVTWEISQPLVFLITEILQHAAKPVGKYRPWSLAETFDFVISVFLLFVWFLLGEQLGISSAFPH